MKGRFKTMLEIISSQLDLAMFMGIGGCVAGLALLFALLAKEFGWFI